MIPLLVLAACTTPSTQAPGWTQVPLGAEPALAAPSDVDQLRAGEEVEVRDLRPSLLVRATEAGWGVMRYELRLPPGAQRVTVDFVADLSAARVDVTAIGQALELPLVQDARVAGKRVRVELPRRAVRHLRVDVHHHLRPRPAVDQTEVIWRAVASKDELGPLAVPGALVYRHPGGRTVELCESPQRPLTLTLTDDVLEAPRHAALP